MSKQTLLLVIDNSLYMQNQDYLPSRIHLQKEVAQIIASNILNNPESSFGIVPIGQIHPNYILTPTKKINLVNNFLSTLKLSNNIDLGKILINCNSILVNRDESLKRLVIFYGSDVEGSEFDNVILELIKNIKINIESGIHVSVIVFGKNGLLIQQILGEEYSGQVVYLNDDNSFLAESLHVLGLSLYEIDGDPDLALALQLSLEESQK